MTDIHTATKDFSALQVNVEDGFVIARMNRPEVRNAIDETMVEEFHTLCGILERDPQILVITGCVVKPPRVHAGFSHPAQISRSCVSVAARMHCAGLIRACFTG